MLQLIDRIIAWAILYYVPTWTGKFFNYQFGLSLVTDSASQTAWFFWLFGAMFWFAILIIVGTVFLQYQLVGGILEWLTTGRRN